MSLGLDRLPTVLEWLRPQDLPASGLSTLIKDQIAERGARMARHDDREYREFLSEEQRSPPGCPDREVVLDQRGQATRPLSRARLDVAPLAGFWVGADRRTTSVDSMDITECDGVCLLRVAGGDATGPRDWGIVEATPHAADVDGSMAIGATARYDFGFLETTLTFFMKSGILILCTFNRWQDESARADCFTREFLYRRTRRGGRTRAAGIVTAGITRGNDRPADLIEGHSAPHASPRVDPSPIAGWFRSCDQSTLGFTEITVVPGDRDIEITLSAAGGSLVDPGRSGQVISIRGAAFGEGVHGGPAGGFLAESESSFQRLVLAAYLNKGLLAIDTFTTFLDGSGRSAYRARDHFYRVG